MIRSWKRWALVLAGVVLALDLVWAVAAGAQRGRVASPPVPAGPPPYGTDDQHPAPGTYVATVPAGSPGCHWARLLAGTWDADGQIAFADAAPGQTVIVTIPAGDVAFRAQGCGPWAAVEQPRPAPPGVLA